MGGYRKHTEHGGSRASRGRVDPWQRGRVRNRVEYEYTEGIK